jgi:hypothetical protein
LRLPRSLIYNNLSCLWQLFVSPRGQTKASSVISVRPRSTAALVAQAAPRPLEKSPTMTAASEAPRGPYTLQRHGGLLQLQVQLHTVASSPGADGIETSQDLEHDYAPNSYPESTSILALFCSIYRSKTCSRSSVSSSGFAGALLRRVCECSGSLSCDVHIRHTVERLDLSLSSRTR